MKFPTPKNQPFPTYSGSLLTAVENVEFAVTQGHSKMMVCLAFSNYKTKV